MEMKAHFGVSSSMASPNGVKTFPAHGHSTLSQGWHVGSMWLSQCTLHTLYNLSACSCRATLMWWTMVLPQSMN